MTGHDVTTSFARTLVDEWVRSGITHAVVSPGSRNTPLVLALARDGRLRVDVVLDERSAAFRALGVGLATGRPAIVCCTSGTAAANMHPAVIEAHHARVPLLVCTADRPPELRDWGAGQTIEQTYLFGRAVRWYHDPGPPVDARGVGAQWRALAGRAVAEAFGPPPGPVHLNLPFREPLVPSGASLVDDSARADGRPWTRTTRVRAEAGPNDIAELAELVRAHPRGLVVAGWGTGADPSTVHRFAAAAGWPVLADAISQLRTGAQTVSTYEALLRSEQFARAHRPELVLRLGAPLTSKVANSWLGVDVPHVVVDPHRSWLDPQRSTAHHVAADANGFLTSLTGALGAQPVHSPWLVSWSAAERRARAAIDRVLDDCDAAIEGQVARDLAAAIPDGGTLVVASSLPVRALEWCMAPRTGLRVLANRGANGIDGFVSTVAGVAAANEGAPTVALSGDLCFLHDTNGLLHMDRNAATTLVVIDNDGGGIFSYLPQHDLPEFEALFATPSGIDPVAVARA
ncbi:MAG: 2-succinyl-5-enolpyruvyl-6-hydroxy-3-cyclohexene-carboxylate synthase, partial [Actinomycetota bacterium]|nr:2-succinyl-5-enolpyruvyl-6-hydroxy-3-cyclohexene-carboxylate synthase [Actinomycetota bacterium]